MKEKTKVVLYVIGKTARSKNSIHELQSIMEKNFQNDYELIVVDLLVEPELAEEDNIMVTPTVVRKAPPPVRKIIGSLSDERSVLAGLELVP